MSSDDGVEKSALLLMTLGTDEAAEVLKLLGPREVQKAWRGDGRHAFAGTRQGRVGA